MRVLLTQGRLRWACNSKTVGYYIAINPRFVLQSETAQHIKDVTSLDLAMQCKYNICYYESWP